MAKKLELSDDGVLSLNSPDNVGLEEALWCIINANPDHEDNRKKRFNDAIYALTGRKPHEGGQTNPLDHHYSILVEKLMREGHFEKPWQAATEVANLSHALDKSSDFDSHIHRHNRNYQRLQRMKKATPEWVDWWVELSDYVEDVLSYLAEHGWPTNIFPRK